jgi:MFS family permease
VSAGIGAQYRAFLATPHVPALLGTAVLARLPAGVSALALVLFLEARTGSFAVAGLVAGALTIGAAIGAPLQGRLVDARGARRVLLPLSLLHAAGLGALVYLGHAGAGVLAMTLVAVVAGAALPPVSSVTRTLWPVLLGGDAGLLNAAFALDSVLIELVFVVGPLLAAGIAVLADPAGALAVSAAAVVFGTAAFTSLAPVRELERSPQVRRGLLGALDSAGMRTLALVTLPVGFSFGAIEITLPAYGEARGAARGRDCCWACMRSAAP